ncbi:polysaccharide biosynthesis tyrosine autokinase [Corynebacterium variabile]|nr:polysaccharide biosynthesis tyrosine autokinase [Corynebacterium variabile]
MTTRVNGRSMTEPAASPLVLSVVLGFVAVAVGLLARRTLDGSRGFGGDAATISSIMHSPFSASDLGLGSYSVIADFYQWLGLADAPTTASVFGAVLGAAVLGCVLIRIHGINGGTLPLLLALLVPVLVGVYEAAYAKEVLISLGMLVVVLLPVNWFGELLVLTTLVVLGAEFRTYWFIVAVVYVVLRICLVRGMLRTPGRVVGAVAVLGVLTGIAVWIGTGNPADAFRYEVNDTAARQNDTGSLITRYIDLPEPVGGIVNTTLTSLLFIAPLPMLLKASPYYLVIGILFAVLWISLVRAAARSREVTTTGPTDDRLLHRFVALPLAFLVVQGLFEPDWGSALRHLTPLLPLLVGAVDLVARRSTDPPGPVAPSDTLTPRSASRPGKTTMTTQTPTPSAGRNVLATYLGHLRRWWWFLVIGLVIGGLLGWGASALMATKYTATAQLYVGTAGATSSSDAYNGAMLSQKQVGSYVEMAKSPTLANRVIDDLDLDKSTGDVQGMITPAARKDTVIIEMHAVSGNADLSRDVANSAATQLKDMVRDLNQQTAPNGRSTAPQLAVLTEATSPSSPSSPNTRQNVMAGAVLCLVLGALAAVVRGLTDRRITTTERIREIIDAPVVGTVSTTEALAEKHTLDFAAAPVAATEQFRELRTNLRFLDVDNPPTVIAVTGGVAGEGKSTIAANLALALADDGESVCLVDADLRDPSVADYLSGNLQSAVGLSTALAGDADIDDIIQQTATPGLGVVTSGTVPPNPAELLGSRRFRDLLTELGEKFDHVILDASPSLPVTDGALVASAADGVLLTVRHNSTTTDRLTSTEGNLSAVNSRILGTVFTLVPEARGKYGASKYGYGYGYGATAPSATSTAGDTH